MWDAPIRGASAQTLSIAVRHSLFPDRRSVVVDDDSATRRRQRLAASGDNTIVSLTRLAAIRSTSVAITFTNVTLSRLQLLSSSQVNTTHLFPGSQMPYSCLDPTIGGDAKIYDPEAPPSAACHKPRAVGDS